MVVVVMVVRGWIVVKESCWSATVWEQDLGGRPVGGDRNCWPLTVTEQLVWLGNPRPSPMQGSSPFWVMTGPR